MGLSYTGSSCLDVTRVSGYSRVPEPPARMMPFIVCASLFQSLRYRSRVYTFSGTSSSAGSARLATITADMRLNSASDAITGRPSKEAALSVGS